MIDILMNVFLAVSIVIIIIAILIGLFLIINDLINDIKKGGNTFLEETRPNKYSKFEKYLFKQSYPDECLYSYNYTESEPTYGKRRFYKNYSNTKRGTGYGTKMKKVKGTYVIKEPRIKFKRKLKIK